MEVFLNIAARKHGKTTLAKQQALYAVKKHGYRDFMVYDPSQEYTDIYREPLVDISDFMEEAKEKTDTFIIFEESTMLFEHTASGKNKKNLLNILLRGRHRKGSRGLGNFVVFNFHSLRGVPLWILDHVDVMFIGKTNDNPSNIEKKFGDFQKIYSAFLQAQANEDKYVKKEVRLLEK